MDRDSGTLAGWGPDDGKDETAFARHGNPEPIPAETVPDPERGSLHPVLVRQVSADSDIYAPFSAFDKDRGIFVVNI